jgi:diaminohydroxyphosphoribosylaminopyrimidine deaminase/5-amino-6-(5-phosphoribosylamino)uracil reductase
VPHTEHPYREFMLQAIELAGQARWQTRPNPCVGALVLRDGRVVARGLHEGAGQPHAEINALEDARRQGVPLAECSLLVTLEPCRHHGLTPPCTDAVLASGIRHVLIGAPDPTAEAGGGAELLRARGLRVETGIELDNCLDLIDDFITWRTTDLPYTLIKLAGTLDGRIATRTGNSQWISSAQTRARVHLLRRHMDALIVGGNTFHLDNPELTCRPENAPPPERQPLAVVVTSRLPEAGAPMRLIQERPASTIFWTTAAAAASPKAEALRRRGVRVLGLSSQIASGKRSHSMRAELNLAEGLAWLRKECDCRYALCEGGGRLGLSLLNSNLARELHLHLAPKILGDNEATPLFDGRSPLLLEDALHLRITDARPSGEDIMLTLRPPRHGDAS